MATCEFCDSVIAEGSNRCSSCGATASLPVQTDPSAPAPSVVHHHHHSQPGLPATGVSPKSRVAAGIIGLFLGALGIHNFYLGYIGRGICQLILTLTLVGFYISCLWAFVEVIIIFTGNPKDAKGLPMVY